MIIKDVVELAKYSELASIHVKNDVGAITAFINMGMLELYKRFPLKVSSHTIELTDAEEYYDMPEDFMYYLQAYHETGQDSAVRGSLIAVSDEDDEKSIFFTD